MSRPEDIPEEVYLAHGEIEAKIIKAKLESFNIPSVLASNASPSVHVFVMDGLGEYRVMVPHSKANEARHLLEGDEEDDV
jgi:hypothetical protein